MPCRCPHCETRIPFSRRLIGILFWIRWHCRACGVKLRWEHASALTGALIFLIAALTLAVLTGRPEVAIVIGILSYAAVVIQNRPDPVHAEGGCLRCGGPMTEQDQVCPQCGWLAT
jgi:hypothetical protein